MATPNGTVVLKDAKIYLGPYDISGDLNQVDIGTTPDMLDNTVFGATYHTTKAGLSKVKANIAGFTQVNATAANAIDGRIYTNLSVVDIPMSVAADGGDAGEDGYFFKAMLGKYNFGGSIGQLAKFTCNAEATGTGVALVKGTIMEDGKTARTSAVNFPVATLGAVTSTQKIYIVVHLLAFTGTDVTFHVMSAVTNFATTTERAIGSLTAMTAVGSQYITPVQETTTDTFWRAYCTTSGGFTTLNAVIIVGIM